MREYVWSSDGTRSAAAPGLGGRWNTYPRHKSITNDRVTNLAHYLAVSGDRALNRGDLDRADDWYAAAQKLKPDYPPTLYSLGKLAQQRGDLDEAARLFRDTAARSDSLDYRTAAMVNLAEVQDKLGDHERAMDTARRAMALHAMGSNSEWTRWHQARAYNALGCDAKHRGDLDEAVRCFKEAVRLAPDCARWLMQLAWAHRDRDEHSLALECLRKAVELWPDDAEPHERLGYVHHRAGNAATAVGEYMHAIELEPDNAEAHHGLACALSKLGYHEEAERQFREAMRLAPDDLLIQVNLGSAIDARPGQHRRAARWLRRVVRAHPDHAKAHLRLGYVLWGHAGRRAVCAEFQRALELDPDGESGQEAREALAKYESPATG